MIFFYFGNTTVVNYPGGGLATESRKRGGMSNKVILEYSDWFQKVAWIVFYGIDRVEMDDKLLSHHDFVVMLWTWGVKKIVSPEGQESTLVSNLNKKLQAVGTAPAPTPLIL